MFIKESLTIKFITVCTCLTLFSYSTLGKYRCLSTRYGVHCWLAVFIINLWASRLLIVARFLDTNRCLLKSWSYEHGVNERNFPTIDKEKDSTQLNNTKYMTVLFFPQRNQETTRERESSLPTDHKICLNTN